jgi:hypothetical protein
MGGFFRSKRGFVALAAFAVAAAILAGGCGGGGDSSGAVEVQTGSLSKAEFIEKADAVCTKNQERTGRELVGYLDKHHIRLTGPLPKAVAAGLLGSVIEPTYRREITEISELGAPDKDAEKVAAMLEAIEAGLAKAQRDPAGAFSRSELVPSAGELARAYGLTECGELWT